MSFNSSFISFWSSSCSHLPLHQWLATKGEELHKLVGSFLSVLPSHSHFPHFSPFCAVFLSPPLCSSQASGSKKETCIFQESAAGRRLLTSLTSLPVPPVAPHTRPWVWSKRGAHSTSRHPLMSSSPPSPLQARGHWGSIGLYDTSTTNSKSIATYSPGCLNWVVCPNVFLECCWWKGDFFPPSNLEWSYLVNLEHTLLGASIHSITVCVCVRVRVRVCVPIWKVRWPHGGT